MAEDKPKTFYDNMSKISGEHRAIRYAIVQADYIMGLLGIYYDGINTSNINISKRVRQNLLRGYGKIKEKTEPTYDETIAKLKQYGQIPFINTSVRRLGILFF